MKSDFEIRILQDKLIKIYRLEIGQLKSEIDELKHTIDTMNKVSPEEKAKIKSGEVWGGFIRRYRAKGKQVHNLKRQTKNLRDEIIRLRVAKQPDTCTASQCQPLQQR